MTENSHILFYVNPYHLFSHSSSWRNSR